MKRLIALFAVVGMFGAVACTPDDGTGTSPAPGIESPAIDPVDPGMESPGTDGGMESPATDGGMESPAP